MKIIRLCIYFVIFSIIIACQASTEEGQEDNQRALDIPNQPRDALNEGTMNGEEIAERLVHLSERVPDVENATAIVLGDLAVIGIDVNHKLDRSDIGVIKYEVAEALKHDPHGAYAFISADPDIVQRLKEMGKEIKAGRPISGIMNELAGIVGRIMPIVPSREHEKSEPDPTNANDEKINKGQENKLENIQEKQGKTDMDKNNKGQE